MIAKHLMAILTAAAVFTLSACDKSGTDGAVTEVASEAAAAENSAVTSDENGFSAQLTKDYDSVSDYFDKSDGWTNGNMFQCTWREKNCTFDNGRLILTIDRDRIGTKSAPYSGGEFRTKDFYGFGYYEVTMKPIKNDGVVSSFFTYTGPTDNNVWDEIDIEFLGKDTTSVQFNYYTDSKGNHEYVYDLGFDASEEFHNYGFDWKEDSITWYVDGEAAYTANENIPRTPGKIMMNVWPGKGVDSWLNKFDDTVPLSAEYTAVSYNKNGKQ